MDKRGQLFQEWKNISNGNINDILMRLEHLGEIVQNDINIPEEQIKEWRKEAFKCYTEWGEEAFKLGERIKELAGKTLQYLRQKEILYDVYVHPESESVWYAESNQDEQYRNLIEQQDGCVELYTQGVSKQEALSTIKKLAAEQGYTGNVDEQP